MEERKLFDRENLDGRLLYKQSGFLVIVDENPLTAGHLLIISEKEHPLCLGELTEFQIKHLSVLISVVRDLLKVTYNSPIAMFECGTVGRTVNELHIHCLPMGQDFDEKIKNRGQSWSFSYSYYDQLLPFHQMYARLHSNRAYLLWSPNQRSSFRVCWVPEQFEHIIKSGYLRRLSAEALGFTDRADGEKMDKDLRRQLVSSTISTLAYPFSQLKLSSLRR